MRHLTLARTASLATLALSLAACSSALLKGSDNTSRASKEAASGTSTSASGDDTAHPGSSNTGGTTTAVATGSGSGAGTAAGATPDKNAGAIAKCLALWGSSSPFTASSPHRTIYAAVTVLGFGNAIDDHQTTTDPELIVIDAAVSVLSSPKYRLMNPKGWYCMVADVNVASNLTIELETTAHLADSRVNVGVLSSGANAGMVDVNVLSDVKVERVAN